MDRVLITGGTGFVGHWMQQAQPDGLDCTYIGSLDYRLWYWHVMDWDYIVHLAPVSPTRAIEAAKRNNARLLYCSSGIVYHPESDKTEYRANKIRWEQECIDSGVDVVIARLFAFRGERLSADHAIVAFENAAKKGEPLRIFGDGNTIRTYMSGEDMARWMWAILLHGQTGEAYDVGSDEPVTMLELAKRYSDNIVIGGGRDVMPCYLPVDTAKTRKLLHV